MGKKNIANHLRMIRDIWLQALPAGAGDVNRTHVTSLGSWHSAIELHPLDAKNIIAYAVSFANIKNPENIISYRSAL